MAVQNNIITGPNLDINLGGYVESGRTFEWKFTVVLADIVALGAFTTGDVILCKMPSRAFIQYAFIKHSTAIVGPSISACTVQLQTATGNRSATLDVFAAVSNTLYEVAIPITQAAVKETTLGVVVPVYLHFVATGANLSVATAGQVDVILAYRCIAA
jgi:hypothetical protein